jgi:hypothetical protein
MFFLTRSLHVNDSLEITIYFLFCGHIFVFNFFRCHTELM